MPDRPAVAVFDPRRAAVRLVPAVVVGLVLAVALPARVPLSERLVAVWDVSAFVASLLSWIVIARSDPATAKLRAAAEDPGRTFVWFTTVLSCAAGLFAATVLLREARHVPAGRALGLIALSIAAIVVSWVLTHTSYTFRYAHLYYRDREGEPAEKGLAFPGDDPPDDMDFAYFAFTVGMTFQVSDVEVPGRRLRRTVLAHALLSFAYNTAIVALAFNLVSGLIS